ncbi:glutathione peroxidase 7-like [Amphiura filiformis]|uniref:glutathione peroxidase 7-like n=1 Tax=Amphiura filiformis TaxID=82378 RepID=UPI003B212373
MSAPIELTSFTKMSPIGTHFLRFYALIIILITCYVTHLQAENDFYSLSAVDIYGNEVSFEEFRGKPTLVVNVASACGYTNQHYSELAWIYDHSDFKDKLNILAFPCNQFGHQEQGTLLSIEKMARQVYKATFPLFTRIETIGENAHPVYRFLTESSGKAPTWNFWKYLVDRDGKVLHAWGPKVTVLEIYHQLYNVVNNIKYSKKEDTTSSKKKKTKESVDAAKDEFEKTKAKEEL